MPPRFAPRPVLPNFQGIYFADARDYEPPISSFTTDDLRV